jgi:hypothetical protein
VRYCIQSAQNTRGARDEPACFGGSGTPGRIRFDEVRDPRGFLRRQLAFKPCVNESFINL